MKDQNKLALIALATMSFFYTASAMADNAFAKPAPQTAIKLCVAEISNYADYSDATRVYHEVESRERRTIGHTLRIDTRIYGEVEDEIIREYATQCVVATGDKPTRFTILETTSGA